MCQLPVSRDLSRGVPASCVARFVARCASSLIDLSTGVQIAFLFFFFRLGQSYKWITCFIIQPVFIKTELLVNRDAELYEKAVTWPYTSAWDGGGDLALRYVKRRGGNGLRGNASKNLLCLKGVEYQLVG